MARAWVRVAFGVLAGLFVLSVFPGPAAAAAGTGCVVSIGYGPRAGAGPVPTGSSEPWSLPLLEGQPDPDHLKRECAHADGHPELTQPLWDGPAWGLPSLGSFV